MTDSLTEYIITNTEIVIGDSLALHSLTHSLTNSLTHSLTHTLTHSHTEYIAETGDCN